MKSGRSLNTRCPLVGCRRAPSGSVASGKSLALFTRDSGGVVGSYARDGRADADTLSMKASYASSLYVTGAVRAREDVRRGGGDDVDVDVVVILRRFGGAVAARAAASTPSSRMRASLRAMFASRVVSYALASVGMAMCGPVGWLARFFGTGRGAARLQLRLRSGLTRCDAETRRGW